MRDMVSNAKNSSNIASISELSGNDSKAREFIATYETPRFPELPTGIDKKYWEEFLDKFTWSIRGKTRIKIECVPFDEGKNSFVFKIEDRTRGIHMVGKIDKKVFT